MQGFPYQTFLFYRRVLQRLAFILCGLFLFIGVCPPSAQAWNIPPLPTDHPFTSDYANALSRETEQQIALLQKQAYQSHDVPVVVVTIDRISDYGTGSIEQLAMVWFNEWGIGKGSTSGDNTGILLLIAMEDRKARIELGADYGRRWDDYCRKIMDDRIIRWFKRDEYNMGVLEGVRALAEIAAMDIDQPPAEIAGEPVSGDMVEKTLRFLNEGEPLTPVSFFSRNISFILIVVGIIFFILAWLYPDYRKTFLILGGLCILFAFVVIVILIVFAIYARLTGRGGSGGFGSSGGFGGGFSGGGGASGGW
ncbi:MAG: TPM domain-containing protein [Candidatus Sumerlaeota bacterium]